MLQNIRTPVLVSVLNANEIIISVVLHCGNHPLCIFLSYVAFSIKTRSNSSKCTYEYRPFLVPNYGAIDVHVYYHAKHWILASHCTVLLPPQKPSSLVEQYLDSSLGRVNYQSSSKRIVKIKHLLWETLPKVVRILLQVRPIMKHMIDVQTPINVRIASFDQVDVEVVPDPWFWGILWGFQNSRVYKSKGTKYWVRKQVRTDPTDPKICLMDSNFL